MTPEPSADQVLVLTIARGWDRVLRRLESGLNHVVGISLPEYRLLRAIAESPGGRASRVDLAEYVSLSPSGVTRALRPLEKLGFVETRKAERDARLALASLTGEGEELVSNASTIVDEVAASILDGTSVGSREQLAVLLDGIAR
ncbi:MAG: MarR family transcriptional regulator [Actinomycetota bacterium]